MERKREKEGRRERETLIHGQALGPFPRLRCWEQQAASGVQPPVNGAHQAARPNERGLLNPSLLWDIKWVKGTAGVEVGCGGCCWLLSLPH